MKFRGVKSYLQKRNRIDDYGVGELRSFVVSLYKIQIKSREEEEENGKVFGLCHSGICYYPQLPKIGLFFGF